MTETTLPVMPLSHDTVRSLHRAGKAVRDATAKRDQLVREAVATGGSLREVGAAVGLSHTAVKFIAHGRHVREAKK